MGIFEKVLQEREGETLTLTPPEAFAAIVVGAASVDGRITPEEATRTSQVFASTRLLRSEAGAPAQAIVQRVMPLFDAYGADQVIGLAAQVLPAPMHAAAFAVAVDLVLADGQAGQAERRYLDRLQDLLQVPDAEAAKIIDVLLVKNSI